MCEDAHLAITALELAFSGCSEAVNVLLCLCEGQSPQNAAWSLSEFCNMQNTPLFGLSSVALSSEVLFRYFHTFRLHHSHHYIHRP